MLQLRIVGEITIAIRVSIGLDNQCHGELPTRNGALWPSVADRQAGKRACPSIFHSFLPSFTFYLSCQSLLEPNANCGFCRRMSTRKLDEI